jgi:NTE family protein
MSAGSEAVGGRQPLALVLPGGGARAAYQVGVLARIAERSGGDARFPIVTGVSAGAINAAVLASNYELEPSAAVELVSRAWRGMSTSKVFRTGAPALAVSALRVLAMALAGGHHGRLEARGLFDTSPLRRTLGAYLGPRRIASNIEAGHLSALALSATNYSTGQTVSFVKEGGSRAMWRRAGRLAIDCEVGVEHVMASCALPLIFPAVKVEGAYYGDGSLRHLTPLSPAIHLGASRILAIAVRRGGGTESDGGPMRYPPTAQIMGQLLNAIFLDAVEADVERVERINRTLEQLPEDKAHAEGLRKIKLAVVRPTRDLGRLAAGMERHLPAPLRFAVRGLGTQGMRSSDLLSYLLFEPPYINRLLELGYEDADREWDRIEPVLAGD